MFLYTFSISALIFFCGILLCINMSCKYIISFFIQILFFLQIFFYFLISVWIIIYGKGYDHRFLRLQYHWHIEFYNWSCPLVFLASLSFRFLIEILFLQVFFFSYFWNFFSLFGLFLFDFISFLVRNKFWNLFFLLEIRNFVFRCFL